MAKKQPDILDLTTTGEIERKHFIVDGKKYEFRDPDELSIIQQQQIKHASAYVNKFVRDGDHERSADAGKKATQLLNDCVNICVVAFPAGVLKKLNDNNKSRIIVAYGKSQGIEVKDDGSIVDKDGKVLQAAPPPGQTDDGEK